MYFLGVDSGSTKTSYVVTAGDGRVLGRHRTKGGTYLGLGEEGLYKHVLEGATAVLAKAGLQMQDIAFAALGFPGYGEAADSEAAVLRACERAIGKGKVICECDCYLGWAGSLAMEPGVNIVSGTGSICYGVDQNGKAERSSGWGYCGDEGSCKWMGEQLISLFQRQSDGRMERTVLYEMFRGHFGLTHDLHFIGQLNHELRGDGAGIARLQMLLSDICDAGDLHARALYNRAAEELCLAASAVAKKLGLAAPYKVSYSGGLFRSGDKILKPLRQNIEKNGAKLIAPRFSPELGAVLMAMRKQDPSICFDDFAFQE